MKVLRVYVQKCLLHQGIGPRDEQAVRYLLSANAEVTVQTTDVTPDAPVGFTVVHGSVEFLEAEVIKKGKETVHCWTLKVFITEATQVHTVVRVVPTS